MAHTNHVVGIIRLDDSSKQGPRFDEDIGRTLQRLRAGRPNVSAADSPVALPNCSTHHRLEDRISGTWDGATRVLTADLRQLARELEFQWREYQRLASPQRHR